MSALDDAIAGLDVCINEGWCQKRAVLYDDHANAVGYCISGGITHVTGDAFRHDEAMECIARALGDPEGDSNAVIRWNDDPFRNIWNIKVLRNALAAQRVPVGDAHNYPLEGR